MSIKSAIETGDLEGLTKLLKDPATLKELSDLAEDETIHLFLSAIRIDKASIMRLLLSIESIRSYVVGSRKVLYAAVHQNNVEIMRILLALPEIRKAAVYLLPYILSDALNQVSTDMLKELFLVTKTFNNPSLWNINGLSKIICSDKFELIDLLFSNRVFLDNISANNNQILKEVIKTADISMFERILSIPAVQDHIAADNNAILKFVVSIYYTSQFKLASKPEIMSSAEAEEISILQKQFDNIVVIKNRLMHIPKVIEEFNRFSIEHTKGIIPISEATQVAEIALIASIPELRTNILLCRELFKKAITEGNLLKVKQWLISIPELQTPIIRAYAEIVLMDGGILHAFQYGTIAIVNELLSMPIISKQAIDYYFTILYHAISSNNPHIVRSCLFVPDRKDNILIKSQALSTQVHSSFKMYYYRLVRNLIEMPDLNIVILQQLLAIPEIFSSFEKERDQILKIASTLTSKDKTNFDILYRILTLFQENNWVIPSIEEDDFVIPHISKEETENLIMMMSEREKAIFNNPELSKTHQKFLLFKYQMHQVQRTLNNQWPIGLPEIIYQYAGLSIQRRHFISQESPRKESLKIT